MVKHGIPTAEHQTFSDIQLAHDYVELKGAPIVIKADGLAAGKGVVVALTLKEAHDAIDSMLSKNIFGDAGAQVVIEEFLDGEEVSFIAICDGETVLPLASSQDHKRLQDDDLGPNTVSPSQIAIKLTSSPSKNSSITTCAPASPKIFLLNIESIAS